MTQAILSVRKTVLGVLHELHVLKQVLSMKGSPLTLVLRFVHYISMYVRGEAEKRYLSLTRQPGTICHKLTVALANRH